MKTKTMTREECEADLNKMIAELHDAGMRVRASRTQSRHIRARNHQWFRYHVEVACGPVEEDACTEMAWHTKDNLQRVYDAVEAMHMVITYQAAVKQMNETAAPLASDVHTARAREWTPREFLRAARAVKKNPTLFLCRHRKLLESWSWADVTVPILHRFDAKELFPTPALLTMIDALERAVGISTPRSAA